MSAKKEEPMVTGVLMQIDQLHENIDAVEDVLDGTYGNPKEVAPDTSQAPRMEDRLEEIGNGLEKGIERIQGLRERLGRLMAQL